MQALQTLLLVFHLLIAAGLVVLVMLQQGKGAEMGAAFGSGASQTLFGSRGSGSFMLKLTALLATLFFATNLVLGYMATQQAKQDPLQALSKLSKTMHQQAPLAPIAPPPASGQSNMMNSAVPPVTDTGVVPADNDLADTDGQLPASNVPPAQQ